MNGLHLFTLIFELTSLWNKVKTSLSTQQLKWSTFILLIRVNFFPLPDSTWGGGTVSRQMTCIYTADVSCMMWMWEERRANFSSKFQAFSPGPKVHTAASPRTLPHQITLPSPSPSPSIVSESQTAAKNAHRGLFESLGNCLRLFAMQTPIDCPEHKSIRVCLHCLDS